MTTVMASYKLHPYEPMTALHPGWDDSLQDLLLQPGATVFQANLRHLGESPFPSPRILYPWEDVLLTFAPLSCLTCLII